MYFISSSEDDIICNCPDKHEFILVLLFTCASFSNKTILSSHTSVLLPGGATWFNETGGYADAGRIIYDIAVDMNKNGVYMPVWGTCLGFELMLYVDKNNQEHRESCSSQGQIIPLELKKGMYSY